MKKVLIVLAIVLVAAVLGMVAGKMLLNKAL